ncbi:hypothetical protein [uncultured Cellulomonas sp.]|uniref:hypothetical protein n=1 Tax=uncultured Cellulomonas sp. TaxID=189682 RepID=UPI0028EDA70C|nr:hypothetical protein [uncultured Cellulomonas sp.]
MTTRPGALAGVVGISIVVVLISAFLWTIGLLLGSPFMASPPSRDGVVGGAVLRVVAVLLWAVPVVAAWQQLGRTAARTTAVVMGTCLAVSLTAAAVIGLW